MKTRHGFVSNSSSTAFVIKNLSKETKTLVDFVRENPQLLDEFNEQYRDDIDPGEFLKSAVDEDFSWKPGESLHCIFGDESGTLVGRVFDYILRAGGSSKNFSWKFEKMLR